MLLNSVLDSKHLVIYRFRMNFEAVVMNHKQFYVILAVNLDCSAELWYTMLRRTEFSDPFRMQSASREQPIAMYWPVLDVQWQLMLAAAVYTSWLQKTRHGMWQYVVARGCCLVAVGGSKLLSAISFRESNRGERHCILED